MNHRTFESYKTLDEKRQKRVDTIINDLIDLHIESLRTTFDSTKERMRPLLVELRNIFKEDFKLYRDAVVQQGNVLFNLQGPAKVSVAPTKSVGPLTVAAEANRKYAAIKAMGFSNDEALQMALTSGNLKENERKYLSQAKSLRSPVGTAGRGAERGLNTAPGPAPGPRPAPRPAPAPLVPLAGVCPIVNRSNYCYMNATMQLLYGIEEIRDTFKSLTDAELDAANVVYFELYPREQAIHLAKLLRQFMQAMKAYIDAPVKPAMIDMTQITGPEGRPLYTEIIEEITQDLEKYMVNANKPFLPGGQSAADEFISRLLDRVFSLRLQSIRTLHKLFTFYYQTTITCPTGYTSTKRDLASDVSLSIGDVAGFNNSIQLALDLNQSDETISEYEGCPGVAETTATKRDVYLVPPSMKYLIVRIQRLTATGRDGRAFITNPQITLNGKRFRIKGAVVHSGTATGGHYVYYQFNQAGVPIYVVSDQDIRPVTASSMNTINKGSTIVLYERESTSEVLPSARLAALNELNIMAEQEAEYMPHKLTKQAFETRKMNLAPNLMNRIKTTERYLAGPTRKMRNDTRRLHEFDAAISTAEAELAAATGTNIAAKRKALENAQARRKKAVVAISRERNAQKALLERAVLKQIDPNKTLQRQVEQANAERARLSKIREDQVYTALQNGSLQTRLERAAAFQALPMESPFGGKRRTRRHSSKKKTTRRH